MRRVWLECGTCKAQYDVGPMFGGCPRCLERGAFAPVEVQYDPGPAPLPADGFPGLWRWHGLLPLDVRDAVTLHEGGTPLLPLGPRPGGAALLLKNETQNPTWSWKDRAASVSVTAAKQLGYTRVATISTGNHGAATAAYAAAAGLGCVVFCHPDAPPVQTDLMAAYGARVVRGGDREALLGKLLARGGWFPATGLCPLAGRTNPFGVEGFKTIAFEVCEQLGWSAPDRVFVPAGSGEGTYGLWKGFRELRAAGRIPRAPRVVACQAAGADSAHRAFLRGEHRVQPLDTVSTRALSVGERQTGDHALRAVYESGGAVRVASDDEAARAAGELARRGIALELSSAVALACALREADGGAGETWVTIGTGAAVKWPDDLARGSQRPPASGPGADDLAALGL